MKVESRLSVIRQSRGIAAADLASRAGVSRQTIYAIESGSYVPNTTVALCLARELEVSVEDLFSLDEPERTTGEPLNATLLAGTEEAAGRPVVLAQIKNRWIATAAGSVPYYLPEADGVVARARKGSSRVAVQLIGAAESVSKRLFLAGCDPAISLLARMAERLVGVEIVTVPASSRRSLDWLKQGLVHIAGSHLEDPGSGDFNVPYLRRLMPKEDLAVVTFARWEEGFVVARRNPLGIRSAADLARPRVRLINRERGSGSRALLDSLLRKAGVPARKVLGYGQVAAGHLDAARSVAEGAADCCLATPSAARAFRLDFVPLHEERFDLAIRREFLELLAVRAILDVLQRAALRRKLESLAGYNTSETGRVVT
jgi:molybdate-binding protein/DNA-binding XRE family transcriptional regulator